jgi:hypothetical protein
MAETPLEGVGWEREEGLGITAGAARPGQLRVRMSEAPHSAQKPAENDHLKKLFFGVRHSTVVSNRHRVETHTNPKKCHSEGRRRIQRSDRMR